MVNVRSNVLAMLRPIMRRAKKHGWASLTKRELAFVSYVFKTYRTINQLLPDRENFFNLAYLAQVPSDKSLDKPDGVEILADIHDKNISKYHPKYVERK